MIYKVEALGGQAEVALLDFMGNETQIVDNARVSYGRTADDFDDDRNTKLLRYLIEHQHGTPFESIVYRFRIKAPVMVWWHLVRHRMASFNLQSGRYTPFEEAAYRPDVLRAQSAKNHQGSDGELSADQQHYLLAAWDEWADKGFQLYRHALDVGMAKEQARMFLPGWNLLYSGIVTINLRSAMNLWKLRCDDHAQEETDEICAAARECARHAHPKLIGYLQQAGMIGR